MGFKDFDVDLTLLKTTDRTFLFPVIHSTGTVGSRMLFANSVNL